MTTLSTWLTPEEVAHFTDVRKWAELAECREAATIVTNFKELALRYEREVLPTQANSDGVRWAGGAWLACQAGDNCNYLGGFIPPPVSLSSAAHWAPQRMAVSRLMRFSSPCSMSP